MSQEPPSIGTRTNRDRDAGTFISMEPDLRLGGSGDEHDERSHSNRHWLSWPQDIKANTHRLPQFMGCMVSFWYEIFILHQANMQRRMAWLEHLHGGGYMVAPWRKLTEDSDRGDCTVRRVYVVEYRDCAKMEGAPITGCIYRSCRMAPWRSIEPRDPDHEDVMSRGNSVGGSMAAAVGSRLRQEKKPPAARILFLDYYLPRSKPFAHPYASLGIQDVPVQGPTTNSRIHSRDRFDLYETLLYDTEPRRLDYKRKEENELLLQYMV
ncbi:hydantoin racemase protein [Rutstroemia sp. NJR-2017a WRK4]|nr:hydantoin racemase protein [Rutstroemia sp. NJR-2017a WRK4]